MKIALAGAFGNLGLEILKQLISKEFEDVLKAGSPEYVIHRPTGYFYDILKVFKPYIEKSAVFVI